MWTVQAGPANHQLRVTERRQLEARQWGTLTKGREEATRRRRWVRDALRLMVGPWLRVAGAQRSRGHLRRGCAATSPGTDWAAQDLQGGGEAEVWNPGGLPGLLTGAGAPARAFRSWSGRKCEGAAYFVGAPLAG